MPLARRRPLLRAAMVGGTAYAAGRHGQRGREREAPQEEPVGAPASEQQDTPAGGLSDATIEQLEKLGKLHDAGVLTDAELAAQKQRLLGS